MWSFIALGIISNTISPILFGTLLPTQSNGLLPHSFQNTTQCYPVNKDFHLFKLKMPQPTVLFSFLVFLLSIALLTIEILYIYIFSKFMCLFNVIPLSFPPGCVHYKEREFSVFCSLLSPQHLEECLTHNRRSINICWISEWLNSKLLSFLTLGNNIYFRILRWESLGYCFKSS